MWDSLSTPVQIQAQIDRQCATTAEVLGLTLDQVCFMGDDLADLRVMLQVGLSVAPAQAHPWTRDRVHWRTHTRGGEGAAREVCDLLLAAQGHAEVLLADIVHVTGVRVERAS